MKHFGDICNINGHEVPLVDVITGGHLVRIYQSRENVRVWTVNEAVCSLK